MTQLTAADFADTGQWRLLLKIFSTGLEAYLKNTIHPDVELQPLCSVKWDMNRDQLRQNIEEAVYSNPRLLDDFATHIIIYDPRTLFIPTQIAEEEAGAEEELYKKIYTAEEADIMTDFDRDITAAWSLAPGVKSFLMRTFPGARITSNLMNLVKTLRKKNEGISLYVSARNEEVDVIMLEGGNLISASTHEWRTPEDIAYISVNLPDVYGYNMGDVDIYISGFPIEESEAWRYISDHSKSLKRLETNSPLE